MVRVIFEDKTNTDSLGARIIASMLNGYLKRYVCPQCYCLTANRDLHIKATHPVA